MNQHDQVRQLRDFGYAPGEYSGICNTCKKEMDWVDKRAVCCKACALGKLSQAKAIPKATRLTRPDVQHIIERLGGISDMGWTFSELALMALISEVEDLVTQRVSAAQREQK